jgi:2-oxoisovalerate dehydrogenase E2 component (dihydrolipoyl transacylase)
MADFVLPDIGEGIVECELVKWLVAAGDSVQEDQPIVEVMTDKALVEIPAKHAGIISKLYYKEGDIAKVHSPLFAIEAVEQSIVDDQDEHTHVSLSEVENTPSTYPKATSYSKHSGKVLASPAVRRIARERGVDMGSIQGSGKKGRILKQDLDAMENPVVHPSTAAKEVSGHTQTETIIEPIRGVKAAMAKQMTLSAKVPYFSVSDEVDVGNLVQLRQTFNSEFAEQHTKVSLMPFFIKALSLALKSFPIINSQVNSECTEIHYQASHNIGMAVDTPSGLVVPNIKHVESLSLMEIATQVTTLTEKARQGKLAATDLQDGTITVSNIGVLGGTTATPVINAPESAIVALGKIQKLPRFNQQGDLIAAHIMQVSWSADHRIIDGATMVKFNNLWTRYLQQPELMLADLR